MATIALEHDECGIFGSTENGRSTRNGSFLSVTFDYEKRTGYQASCKTIDLKMVDNRVVSLCGGAKNFIHVSFAPLFKKCFFLDNTQPKEIVMSVLRNGILLQFSGRGLTRKFIFCGHSNSQLKTRSCFFYAANNSNEVNQIIHQFGNFAQIKSVEKFVKRVGLLFSNSIYDEELLPEETEEISDVVRNHHIFTDGCGFIAESYAKKLMAKMDIKTLPKNYIPSVFQIRYRGYKGVLTVIQDKHMISMSQHSLIQKLLSILLTALGGNRPKRVYFRNSMKKFDSRFDNTFAILDYSKPSFCGALNTEIVNLLLSNGIPNEVFLKKQEEYFNYVRNVDYSKRDHVLKFLQVVKHFDLYKRVHYSMSNSIQGKVQQLKQSELNKSLNDDKIARIYIKIPNARLLIGVSDFSGKLKAGECYIRLLLSDFTETKALTGPVLVTRNPCLFPGDIQFLTARDNIPMLSHLKDCIVFSIQGNRPDVSNFSGGDLDGDKFFVTWDPELLQMKKKAPLNYSKLTPKNSRVNHVSWDDRIKYFAQYETELGQITSLYWKWVNANPILRANEKECKLLAKLYARCVDGEKVYIPVNLQRPPPPLLDGEDILSQLKENIRRVHGSKFLEQTSATTNSSNHLAQQDFRLDDFFPERRWPSQGFEAMLLLGVLALLIKFGFLVQCTSYI